MQDLINNALIVFRGVIRFRWVALLVASILALSGWAYVYRMPNIYEASARVYVDTNRVLQPLLRGMAIQPDLRERVRLMSRTLLSRTNLVTIARSANPDFDSLSAAESEAVLSGLYANTYLTGERGNLSLYSLSITNPDRDQAKRMLESLIDVFIETSSQDDGNDSESAQVFLTKQIEINEKRLAESEKRLSDFKKANAGKMPGESGGYYQRLDSARLRLRDAKLELLELENRRNTLLRQINNERGAVVSADDGVTPFSPLDATIQSQNSELAALLVRYTDRHPRVAQLRESIAELEARKIRIQAEDPQNRNDSSLDFLASPIYQEMRRMLTETEGRVSELTVRVSEYTKEVNELNDTVESIPQVEADLEQLDRGYNVVKNQYESLLNKREAARLSEQLEQNVDDVKVRVIDPPFVASSPVAPPKLMLTMGILLAAFGVGAGIAFLLALLKPVFYDGETIATRFGGEFLGNVSDQRTSLSKIAEIGSWLVFCVVLFALCAIGIALLATYAGIINDVEIEDIVNLLPLSVLDKLSALRS